MCLTCLSLWGDGTTAAADGTKYDLYEQNLLSEYHIRYGGYGGIAYHHVADTYVALRESFYFLWYLGSCLYYRRSVTKPFQIFNLIQFMGILKVNRLPFLLYLTY